MNSRLNEILSTPCPLAEIRKKIFEVNGLFDSREVGLFYLTHLHRVIYQVASCASPSGNTIKGVLSPFIRRYRIGWREAKYAEIGSHVGRSAATAALANHYLQIYCYDNPNSGWGGQPGTELYLEKTLIKFASGRSLVKFGDSHSPRIIKSIRENAPYDIFVVDGDHSPDGAYQDLLLAYSVLKEGGILIFDDIVHHKELGPMFVHLTDLYPHKEIVYIKTLLPEERSNGLMLRGIGLMVK